MSEHIQGHLDDERLQAYLDFGLPEAESVRIDAHLAGCTRCRERLAAFRRLFATIETSPEVPLGKDLTPSVIRAIAWHERQRGAVRLGIPAAEVVTVAVLLLAAWRFVDVGLQTLHSTLVGVLAALTLLPGQLLLPLAVAWPRWTGRLSLDLIDMRSVSVSGLWTSVAMVAGVAIWIAGNWLLLRKQGARNGHLE